MAVTRTVHALVATSVDGAGWLAFFRDLVARGLTGEQTLHAIAA